ncbi:MAG TPA: leucine-rich repeat domain-containing protein [Gemmataceae bacterium]|nr:leucine-rich repeat domain-containing protein [Gemmataceae bacterium]
MPREQQITVTRGTVRREYVVVYRDDPPERHEAVQFFQKHADCLFPDMAVPPEVAAMPIKEANAYLRRHPVQERWSLLTIGRQDPIRDADLARLRHLPEISHVKIFSDQITDAGVKHLLFLDCLSCLVLDSNRVSDECLKDIRTMRSLVALDLQAASGLSREAVLAVVEAMSWLQDAWPPPDPVRLAECQRRSRLSQGIPSGQPVPQPATEPPRSGEPLRYVDLSRRPVPRLPDELFSKDDVWRLDLISCGVEVLPDAIGNLTRLRTLYVNWGRLTELPGTMGQLTSLEAMWLNDNRLNGLPDSVRRLTGLKKLALDNNLLEQFPEAILELKQLEELRLTGNRMFLLPDGIGNLTELRILSLGHNRLATLPGTIRRLDKLTYLGLQGNPLESLPDAVWRLPCLITLNLAHTGLTELPPEAANVPNIIGLPGRRVRS